MTLTNHRIVGTGTVEEAGDRFDTLRKSQRIVKVEEPERAYWMVLDHELMRECLQNPEVFSSEVVTPLNPEPHFKMIPIQLDRKSVGEGKSVSVRVELGGRRIIKKK